MQNLIQSLKFPPSTHLEETPNQPHILSSLLHSFSIYNCDPTPEAYYFVIKILAKSSQFSHIASVLDHLEKNEKLEIPEYIFTHLIKIYSDNDRIEDAVRLFYRIPNFRCVPSVHSLNTLLSVVCRNREFVKMVPKILLQSQYMNIRMEESCFRILIRTLCRMNRVGYAIKTLNCMINDGHTVDDRTLSIILSSVCGQKHLSSAEITGFLEELRKLGFCPGIVDYTNVIRVLVRKEKGLDALHVLNQMKSSGIKPDIVCYTMVMRGVVKEENYNKADQLFDELLVLGLVPDIYTFNVYINGLCKQRQIEAGIKMVSSMEELGCKANVVTYNTLLLAMCKVGELSRSREIIKDMGLKGIAMNLHTYRIMIDGLVSQGEISDACVMLEEVLDKFPCPPSLMFDEPICGLCYRGLVSKAMELVKKMADKNVPPGGRVWEALLDSSGSKHDSVATVLLNLANSG